MTSDNGYVDISGLYGLEGSSSGRWKGLVVGGKTACCKVNGLLDHQEISISKAKDGRLVSVMTFVSAAR